MHGGWGGKPGTVLPDAAWTLAIAARGGCARASCLLPASDSVHGVRYKEGSRLLLWGQPISCDAGSCPSCLCLAQENPSNAQAHHLPLWAVGGLGRVVGSCTIAAGRHGVRRLSLRLLTRLLLRPCQLACGLVVAGQSAHRAHLGTRAPLLPRLGLQTQGDGCERQNSAFPDCRCRDCLSQLTRAQTLQP